MRVAVYSITHNRLALTEQSFDMLRRWAGMEFHHYVFDNGSEDGTPDVLSQILNKGHIRFLKLADKNFGQNIAANVMLDEILRGDYEWIMRWDNDMIPRTRRFMRRLVRCADTFMENGLSVVVAPTITKLKFPPEPFAIGDDVGFDYQVVKILGGQCRLHHRSFFDGWRFNKFGALGFGEANEVADRCYNLNIPKIKLPDIEVEHYKGEDAQIEEMPEYFSFEAREVGRYVGYGL